MSPSVDVGERLFSELLEPDKHMKRSEVADRFEAVLNSLKVAGKDAPRTTFDPSAVISQTGREPTAIFAWVRDKTVLVPYRGVLRGPAGVLLDRYGNSLDRSLLLTRLLQLAGHEARLAHATLTTEQAQTIYRQAMSSPAPPPEPPAAAETSRGPEIDALARSLKIDPRELRSRFEAIHDAADLSAANARRRSASQSAQLEALLTEKLAASAISVDRSAPFRDHWWVQFNQQGHWVDLDPVLLPAGPSRSPVDAIRTLNPETPLRDLHHLLRVRVIVERATQGRLEEQVVLEHTFELSGTIGVPITLAQIPSQGVPDLGAQPEGRATDYFSSWLDQQQVWLPVIVAGDAYYIQSGFDLTGKLRRPGSTISLSPGAGFSDALGGGDSEPEASELTGEFVEYEFVVPGSPSRIERRTLVDAIGASARRSGKIPAAGSRPAIMSLDLLQETEILPVVAQPSQGFVTQLFAESFIAAGDGLLGLLRGDQRVSGPAGPAATDAPRELYDLALARHDWSPVAQSVVITGANLLTRHTGLRDGAGSLFSWSAFDIVKNDVDIRSDDDSKRRSMRVAQGVVDTNAEALLASGNAGGGNVSSLMPGEVASGMRWVVLAGNAVADETAGKLSAEVLAGVSSDISRGYLAVVPIGQGADAKRAFGWWRVDPVTGTVLGIDERGRGGASDEDVALEVNAIQTARASYELLKLLTCTFSSGIMAMTIAQKTNSRVLGAGAMLPDMAFCLAGAYLKVAGGIGSGSQLARGYYSLFGDLLGLASWSYKFTMGWWAKYG